MEQFLEPPKEFKKPEKCILNQRYNMDHFRHSAVYVLITRFIALVSDSIQGLPFGNAPDPSENCKKLLAILEKAHQMFKDTPLFLVMSVMVTRRLELLFRSFVRAVLRGTRRSCQRNTKKQP